MDTARILIVEDELIVAQNLQSRLQGLGYTVPAIAAAGEEALELIDDVRPDLVLMDIRLGGELDGITTASYIHSRYGTPVIYLTAYLDPETVQRAKFTEPFGYILKPFDLRELQITIEMALYKHSMERKLRESETWLATTLRSIGDAVITVDRSSLVTFLNPAAERLTGWRQEGVIGRPLKEIFSVLDEDTQQLLVNPVEQVLRSGTVVHLGPHTLLVNRNGGAVPIDDSAAPIINDTGEVIGVVLVFFDITERRKAEQERERLIIELEAALAKIKTLRGLIPICASCKKIRSDTGAWTRLEQYISEHSEAEFSHGICPDCAQRLYGDLLNEG